MFLWQRQRSKNQVDMCKCFFKLLLADIPMAKTSHLVKPRNQRWDRVPCPEWKSTTKLQGKGRCARMGGRGRVTNAVNPPHSFFSFPPLLNWGVDLLPLLILKSLMETAQGEILLNLLPLFLGWCFNSTFWFLNNNDNNKSNNSNNND